MNKFAKYIAIGLVLVSQHALAIFDECLDYFPNQITPTTLQKGRALCFDSFAVFYSPETKKPIYTIEKLNQERLQTANHSRTNLFYEEARLPSHERAHLEDYRGSGFDRGHNAPAADMPNERAMAQSFSLANMMPQAPENNRGIWAKAVEKATRNYVKRAQGDVFVYTGSIGEAGTIGRGKVVVPTHLFKLVFDAHRNKAWAYWVENTNDAKMNRPISYQELVDRTGIDFGLKSIVN